MKNSSLHFAINFIFTATRWVNWLSTNNRRRKNLRSTSSDEVRKIAGVNNGDGITNAIESLTKSNKRWN